MVQRKGLIEAALATTELSSHRVGPEGKRRISASGNRRMWIGIGVNDRRAGGEAGRKTWAGIVPVERRNGIQARRFPRMRVEVWRIARFCGA
jgi:hypothetical protein